MIYLDLPLANTVADKLGLVIETELGKGFFGYAYKLTDGRVLKLTRDMEEYATSITLQGKEYHNIVKIFECHKVKVVKDFFGSPVTTQFYVIIREYVDSPSALEGIFGIAEFCSSLRRFSEGYGTIAGKREESRDIKQLCPEKADYIDQLWMVLEDSVRAGFQRVDIKPDNLGMKNGVLKLLDTGYSGNEDIPMTEAITLEM